MRTCYSLRICTCAIAAYIGVPLAFAQLPAQHVYNFGQVSTTIYRGAEPSSVGVEELGAMGVKTVIDLREHSGATEQEKKEVEKLGMKYINIPLGQFSAPTDAQVEKVLKVLSRPDSGITFIHCRRGKDRTGTMIACYRIQHDHWTNGRALAEANSYGMSHLERAMRSYIVHFKGLSQPDPVSGLANSASNRGDPSTSSTARP